MPDYSEIELKLRLLDQDIANKLCKKLFIQPVKQASMPKTFKYETVYYDTYDHRLSKNYLAYRVRREGNHYKATVKDSGASQGGLHIRHEWEKELDNNNPTIQPFIDLPIGAKLHELLGEDLLIPLFKTWFERTVINLTTESGSVVEMAVDIGDIVSEDKKEPLNEIELELKTGQISDLLVIGSALSQQYPMLLEERSKFYRGLVLSGHSMARKQIWEPEISKEEISNFNPSENLVTCLQAIMRLQNAYLDNPEDIEIVYRLREKADQCLNSAYLLKTKFDQTQYLMIWDKLQNMVNTFDRLLGTYNMQEKREKQTINLDLPMNNYPVRLEFSTEGLEEEYKNEQLRIYQSLSQGTLTPDLLIIWAWVIDKFN